MPRTSGIKPTRPVTPIELRDFSKGRITKYSANTYLIPKNSVSETMNINYDTIIGSGVVRPGTTLLGSTVASGKSPLGMAEFVGPNGSPNLQFAVMTGASTSTLYYFDTSWHASGLNNLSNTAKCRFATIGGRSFIVNGVVFQSSADGNVWNNTSCNFFTGILPTMIMRTRQRLIAAGELTTGSSVDRVFFSSVINPNNTKFTVSSMTRSGSTVTITTSTAHNFVDNDFVTISGANEAGYNGTWPAVTTLIPTIFNVNITGTPATPATGSITVFKSALTWNTEPVVGDWIDINPDDNGNITALAETADQTLVFKNDGMYRLDVINKSVDSANIFNVGAVSQEAVTTCNGLCYFYSGMDIRRTNGGFPEILSRLSVQDFIDAIPQANDTSVVAGNDGQNVYFSIGDITLNSSQDNQVSYTNVVLKFSTRDEAWSVHSYAQKPARFSNFTYSTDGRKMLFADTAGNVQTFDKGTTDNGTPIFYSLETQEQEFGNRSHVNTLSDLITVFTKNGIDSKLQTKGNDNDYDDVKITLDKRVNTGDSLMVDGNYVTFKWFGESSGTAPVFEGLYLEDINDEGQINNS